MIRTSGPIALRLVSALKQAHQIFFTLFFFIIVEGEAELLHQFINAIELSVDPIPVFFVESFPGLNPVQQRIQSRIVFQLFQLFTGGKLWSGRHFFRFRRLTCWHAQRNRLFAAQTRIGKVFPLSLNCPAGNRCYGYRTKGRDAFSGACDRAPAGSALHASNGVYLAL